MASCVGLDERRHSGVISPSGKRRATGRGRDNDGDFARYHAVLDRACWSALAASRILLGLLVDRCAHDGPIVIGLDVGWWRSQHAEDFEIIHDESTYFFERQHLWDMMTSMTASNAVVHVAHKSIRFPLRVKKTNEGDLKLLSSLQICDLIAGFVARAKAGNLSDEQREVIGAMVTAGMGEIGYDCVSPRDKYAQGMPPVADGPDAVDQIVLASRPRST